MDRNKDGLRKIAVLGSTGSIGTNALKVARHLKNSIEVKVLAAKSNIDLLEVQAREFEPELLAVYDEDKAYELRQRLPSIKILSGMAGLLEAATHASVDFVVSAMSGTVGILPTAAAIEHGKHIGLANKEVLVSAGAVIMSLVAEKGVDFIPLDSEHNAIFQCLQGQRSQEVERLILTASGGPFHGFSAAQLKEVTLADALQHPTYRMGAKNTIDSSTLMNKGLEVIEAHFLFGFPLDKIEVVIHPQSVIHSLVEFKDGSILAQLSEPNMLLPIQYALTYPTRKPGLARRFDFKNNPRLDFYTPDSDVFTCLALAYAALRRGGSLPCYMNAANEILVKRFLNGHVSWSDIPDKLGRLMELHEIEQCLDLKKIIEIDESARQTALIF